MIEASEHFYHDDPNSGPADVRTGMLQVSFIAYAVGGLFLGMGYFDLYYHLIATVVAMGVIVKAELAKTPGASLPWEKKGPDTPAEAAKPRFAPMPGFTPGRKG